MNFVADANISDGRLEATVTCGGCQREFNLGAVDAASTSRLNRLRWRLIEKPRAQRRTRMWNHHQQHCHKEN